MEEFDGLGKMENDDDDDDDDDDELIDGRMMNDVESDSVGVEGRMK